MFGLYKRSLTDANGLSALLTMVLLDESVYKAQRNAMIEFAKITPAKDAYDLAAITHNALCEMSAKLWKDGHSPVLAAGSLWKAKQGGITPT